MLALPRPIYDPGCQPSYEGLVPQSRAFKSATATATAAKPGAQAAPMASAGAPVAPCGGPQCLRALLGGHGGSAGRRSKREF